MWSGWLCVLGWQAGSASGCYLAATEIQGLAILNNPSYTPQRWQGTLLAIALASISLFFNSALAKNLPSIEGVLLLLHVSGFIAILVTLWALAPHSSSRDVFNKFNDGGDWHSMALAALVGILSPTVSLIGPDAVVHVSEEVRNASKTVPQIMLATAIANGLFGFVMLITICYCLGNLDDVLFTPTGYPFIQVCHNLGPTVLRSLFLITKEYTGILQCHGLERRCNYHDLYSSDIVILWRGDKYGHCFPSAVVFCP